MNNTQTVSFLCQCLAFWNPDLTAAAKQTINSGQADWHRVLRYAGRHNVAPVLYSSLNSSGLLHSVPDDETEYLQAVWSLNRQRNRMLRQALVSVCGQLNTIGITPLLLKGAAGLVPGGEYPGAADRVMADLDLLIPAGHIEDAWNALQQIGYSPMFHGRRAKVFKQTHHHHVPLEASDAPVRIELHRSSLGLKAKKYKNFDNSAWNYAESKQFQGADMAVPDTAFRVLHNFAHHRLNDMGFANNLLDLRRLYEFVQLCRTWDTEIQYDQLNSYCADKKISAAWQAYWLSAQRFFALPLPVHVDRLSYAQYKDVQVQLCVQFPLLLIGDHWLRRAGRLPKRLVTPSWYPMKYRQLTSTEEFAKNSVEQ